MEVEEAVRRMGLARNHRDRHWSRAVKVADNAVQRASSEWLSELMEALLRVESPTYPMWYGFTVALRRLATAPGGPGTDTGRVAAVREFAAAGLGWAEVRYTLPEVAEWLAIGQPAQQLMAVFETAQASDELAACLLQETALRHDASAAAGFSRRLREAGHPLGELPLRALPAELGHFSDDDNDDDPGMAAPGPEVVAAKATELEWPSAGIALSAHRSWISQDGSTTEARLFSLDRSIAPDDFGASVLRILGAASVAGLTGTRRVTTAEVLRTLFRAAAGGSAYGPRMHGAYGRLASWESLGALVGVPGEEALAWLFYTSPWFLNVAPSMDTGIAVLRPDRRTIAILAATGSD